MKKVRLCFASAIVSLAISPMAMAQIGAELPLFDGGAVDGWSGITVMHGSQIPIGKKVDAVQYYAAENRDAVFEEAYNVVPFVVRQEGGSVEDGEGRFFIHEIGPTHTPSETGLNEFNWGSFGIPNDDHLYHPGFVQWQQDFDNNAGGVVSFAGNGGQGMAQFDVNSSSYTPDDFDIEPEMEISSFGHRSGFDGRDYQMNFTISDCVDPCQALEAPETPDPPGPVEGQIGTPLPLSNGGAVDGWSTITTMHGHELPAGETVEAVHYYAADNRDAAFQDELYHVVPLIVKQEGGSLESPDGEFSVFEVGPAHTPTEAGEHTFAWGSGEIPEDGDLYHPAILSWQEGANDSNGGAVSFAGNGGTGTIQYNVDSTDFIPGEELDDPANGVIESEFLLTGLQVHTSGPGGREYKVNFEMSNFGGTGIPGDFNDDEILDGLDIDLLTAEVIARTNNEDFNLDDNSAVNQDDRTVWVKDLSNTWFGDSNLDGEFNSSDFVEVFQAGKFETGQPASWGQGDWDGDGVFSSSDFVIAFQDGGFERGPRDAVSAVPEPSSCVLLGFGLLIMAFRRRQI